MAVWPGVFYRSARSTQVDKPLDEPVDAGSTLPTAAQAYVSGG